MWQRQGCTAAAHISTAAEHRGSRSPVHPILATHASLLFICQHAQLQPLR